MKREIYLFFKEKSNLFLMLCILFLGCSSNRMIPEEQNPVVKSIQMIQNICMGIPFLLEILMAVNLGKEFEKRTIYLQLIQKPLWKLVWHRMAIVLWIAVCCYALQIFVVFSNGLSWYQAIYSGLWMYLYSSILLLIVAMLTFFTKSMICSLVYIVTKFLAENELNLLYSPKSVFLRLANQYFRGSLELNYVHMLLGILICSLAVGLFLGVIRHKRINI